MNTATEAPVTETPIPSIPVPAATVLLCRDSPRGIEVFMVERHQKSDAFAGALVFPGGKVDAQDGAEVEETPFGLPMRCAAIRELFEEAGFLLAHDQNTGAHLTTERAAFIVDRYRDAVRLHGRDFRAMLAEEGLEPAVGALVPFARWVTPKAGRRRFDTYFFLAAAIEGQLGTHDGQELVQSVWMTPQETIAAGEAGRYRVLFPTQCQLEKLDRRKTIAEAFAAAKAERIVIVEPISVSTSEGKFVQIPTEAGYPVSTTKITPNAFEVYEGR